MGEDLLLETIKVYNQLGKKYTDKIARVELPQVPEFMDMLSPGARILDVGCAAGRDSRIFFGKGFKVVGVDLSEKFIGIAKKESSHIDFVLADVRELPFRNGIFGGVWANAILLNLDRLEIPKIFQSLNKTMEKGGMLFVGVKEGEGEKTTREPLVGNLMRRETYFREQEMKKFLKDSGFKTVKSYVCGDALSRSSTKWLCVFSEKQNI